MKKIFSFIILLVLLIPFSVSALNESYVITKYNLKIKVNDRNDLDIKENLTVFFNTQKQGIERLIPLERQIPINNSFSVSRASVRAVDVDNKFTLYDKTINQKKYKVIKIGDTNQAVLGEQEYKVSYIYSLGSDLIEDRDDFTYTIDTNEWNAKIDSMVFEIEMPERIDQSLLSLSLESESKTSSAGLTYYVQDNKLIGSYYQPLEIGEKLSIHLILPDGYFMSLEEQQLEEKQIKQTFNIINVAISSILLVISLYLVSYYNKGTSKVKRAYYPSKKCNSIEAIFFLKKKLDSTTIVNYIICLANKGYVQIIEDKEKGLIVKKIKNYDGNNPLEKVFMDELFMNEPFIAKEKLNTKIMSMITPLMLNFHHLTANNNLFLKSNKRRRIMQVFLAICLLVSNILIFLPTDDIFKMLLGIVVKGLIETFIIAVITKINNRKDLLISIPFILLLIYFDYYFITLMIYSQYLLVYLYNLLVVSTLAYMTTKVSLKTAQGNQIVNETKAFLRFIKTAEGKELVTIFTNDHNYFYEVLPYILSLKISPKLINRFNDCPFYLPNWYIGSNYNSYKDFYTYLYQAFGTITFSPLPVNEQKTNEEKIK